MSSLCPGADDVDILGIFLKSFGAVIVFFCLAASICHSFRRGCFHKKGHNENKWVETTLAKERRNVGLSLILDHIQDFFFIIVYFLCFSYNWPAQTDGVDYGDADEVNNLSYCE